MTRRTPALLTSAVVGLALLLPTGRGGEPRPPVAGLSLRTAAGERVGWKDVAGKHATVAVFLSPDCPMSAGYAKPLADVAAAYAKKGVAFVGFFPTDEDAARVAKQAEELKFGFPVFRDETLAAADALGATVTPQVFVLDSAGEVRYRGLIDDGYSKRLVPNRKVTEYYLTAAIDAVLAGKPVAVPKTEPIGCKITRDRPAKAAVAGAPVFHKDVLPILQQHCQGCHRPGEVGPFSLTTYKHAVNWADDLKEFTHNRRMPPWKPRGGKEFIGDRRLAEADIGTLAKWVDAGCPEGDPRDAPPPAKFADGWQLGKPDLILEPDDDFILGATGRDLFQVFVMPTGLTEDRYVVAVEVRPGNPRVVHHAVNFFDATGSTRKLQDRAHQKPHQPGDVDVGPGFASGMVPGFRFRASDLLSGRPPIGPLGGWAPGMAARAWPEGTGFLLPRGSDFVMQIHYHRNGRVERDRTKVGIYLSQAPVDRPILGIVIPGRFKIDETHDGLGYIPAGDPHFVARGTWYTMEDCTVRAVAPHMHLLGKSVKITMTPPGGQPELLIDVPEWEYNWQDNYILKEPLRVRAGTRFDVEAVFDNSSANPNNPSDPPVDVKFGEQTTDEMLFGLLSATKDNPRSGLPFVISQGPFRLAR
jgi:hypothetical protein